MPCVVTCNSITQTHHIWGCSAISSGINVGHWAIIPLSVELHCISSGHPHNISFYKKEFEINYGTEIELFFKMIEDRRVFNQWVPDDRVLEAIKNR